MEEYTVRETTGYLADVREAASFHDTATYKQFIGHIATHFASKPARDSLGKAGRPIAKTLRHEHARLGMKTPRYLGNWWLPVQSDNDADDAKGSYNTPTMTAAPSSGASNSASVGSGASAGP